MPRYRRPRGDAMRARILTELQARGTDTPTYEELAATLGVRVNTVRHHIQILVADGVLSARPHTSRSIRLTPPVAAAS